MKTLAAVLAASLLAASLLAATGGLAQTSSYVSPPPGYVPPQIEAPPAFHGGQASGPPPVQPLFPEPNVGAPGAFPVAPAPQPPANRRG